MTSSANKTLFVEDPNLLARLKNCTNLPSPPGVAARIIELAQDPSANMGAVADAVSLDPALSAKMLRIANSPMYARQRKADNLRQVILLLGLNGTLNLALSFSLVSTLHYKSQDGMDYSLFWRRSLFAAICSRMLGVHFQSKVKEELFLAALLQDIGMLALDKVAPDLYQGIGFKQTNHELIEQLERDKIGAPHSQVGAWLLQTWNFPEWLLNAVATSHNPPEGELKQDSDLICRCVCVAGAMADIWIRKDYESASEQVAERAHALLGIDRTVLTSILEHAGDELNETASLFDVDLGDAQLMEAILERAKEVLLQRTLGPKPSAGSHPEIGASNDGVEKLEFANQRDELTGLCNQSQFEVGLKEEFSSAHQHGWPLALAHIELDQYDAVNQRHGKQVGQALLKAAAALITKTTRDSDLSARFQDDRFVVALVGTGTEGARVTFARMVKAFCDAGFMVENAQRLNITVSIGLAVYGEGADFATTGNLLDAAADALDMAKSSGGNRYSLYDPDFVVAI